MAWIPWKSQYVSWDETHLLVGCRMSILVESLSSYYYKISNFPWKLKTFYSFLLKMQFFIQASLKSIQWNRRTPLLRILSRWNYYEMLSELVQMIWWISTSCGMLWNGEDSAQNPIHHITRVSYAREIYRPTKFIHIQCDIYNSIHAIYSR